MGGVFLGTPPVENFACLLAQAAFFCFIAFLRRRVVKIDQSLGDGMGAESSHAPIPCWPSPWPFCEGAADPHSLYFNLELAGCNRPELGALRTKKHYCFLAARRAASATRLTRASAARTTGFFPCFHAFPLRRSTFRTLIFFTSFLKVLSSLRCFPLWAFQLVRWLNRPERATTFGVVVLGNLFYKVEWLMEP